MLILCDNNGCHKTSNALLNTETKEVICQECGKSITNISESMKRVLKTSGQIVRNNIKKAFMVLCRKCNANREPVLDKEGKTVCKLCLAPIALTASFKLAMESAGFKLDKLENPPKEEEKTK